ncbi:CaiB/BaiF CoA transferase family protein [Roseobacter sp. GAI101]|uniref:CaiB/BaiF CoA transferase family protein n=1 Tax=Roseobacter sp. (strain GAI101) TaxID=391589 RepID=UPI000187152F|nr:CoA transferase [Roseobacter sp. GAI101]EEB84008.1 putative acyl-CoA transferases/ carnitine dehydratase [Roseobacter sp. GAI101]
MKSDFETAGTADAQAADAEEGRGFQPLAGLRVVDLSQVLAGPFATYQLSLLGAEVLKIEKPGEGDWTRNGGPSGALSEMGMGLNFLAHNASKKSVTLDLKSPEGLAALKRLIATADIFVENFKPGVAERLGLGFEAVREICPQVVYCSISAYGQDGPLRQRPAYDHVIQGMCGIMMTTGQKGDGPTKVGAPFVDYATGMNAAMAILAGLAEVRRTGQAVQMDVAMLDTALMMMASLVTQHLTAGWMPAQNGNEAWSQSPSSGAFQTSSGVLMLAANNDRQFVKLCEAVGRAGILADQRWATPAARAETAIELREELVALFLTRPAAEWEEILAAAEVPAARVRSLDEVVQEEQFAARDLISEMTIQGRDLPVHVPNLPFKANGTNLHPASAPPVLGSDTEAVLRCAGLSAQDIATMRDAGVI